MIGLCLVVSNLIQRSQLSLLLVMRRQGEVGFVPSGEFPTKANSDSSTATTWALFALSIDPRVQSKLRDELLTVSSDNVSMDELNALPYLDAVVRETLRIHAPVPSTLRVAVKDDVLPLTTPVTDRNGKVYDSIP